MLDSALLNEFPVFIRFLRQKLVEYVALNSTCKRRKGSQKLEEAHAECEHVHLIAGVRLLLDDAGANEAGCADIVFFQ